MGVFVGSLIVFYTISTFECIKNLRISYIDAYFPESRQELEPYHHCTATDHGEQKCAESAETLKVSETVERTPVSTTLS